MRKFIRDCFTGVDNVTWDWMRVGIGFGSILMGIGMAIMCGAAVHSTWRGHLDYGAFGAGMVAMAGGLGGILVAGGAGLWIKRTTEPQIVTATRTDAGGNTSSSSLETGSPKPDPASAG